jgi:hypothetical protein
MPTKPSWSMGRDIADFFGVDSCDHFLMPQK